MNDDTNMTPGIKRSGTYFVAVSIPIGVDFDGPVSDEELRDALLENFIAHPALKSISDLKVYLDSITQDEDKEE